MTRKTTISLAKIKLGLQERFSLGNLEARRDWGFAGDYVEAMHLMLQVKKPDDFVIATGVSHSIRDLVEEVCKVFDIPIRWKGKGMKEVGVTTGGRVILTVDKQFYRPAEVDYLCGDASKARRVLGWKPKVSFEELIEMMAKADLEHLSRMKRG